MLSKINLYQQKITIAYLLHNKIIYLKCLVIIQLNNILKD